MRLVRILTGGAAFGLIFGSITGIPTAQAATDSNFYSCPAGQTPVPQPIAPLATVPADKPTGSRTDLVVTQSEGAYYQVVPVRVGNQEFSMLLDTGSSWMILNANAVANNPDLVPTGQTAAVSYGGGAMCAAGPVMRGPVSLGGLKPRMVTFLMATSGNLEDVGILGINTWDPPASTLDHPVEALKIKQFELTMTQRTFDPNALGKLTLNAQPKITKANQRRVATFRNKTVSGGGRINIPGIIRNNSGQRTQGNYMLDIGTYWNLIALKQRAARELGYNFGTSTWANPNIELGVTARPGSGPAFKLVPDGPVTTANDIIAWTNAVVAKPENGLIGLAGTSAVIGADYIRPWVFGVRFTKRGSIVKLLARDRQPAKLSGCGKLPVTEIKRSGLTRLVPAGCKANGSKLQVRVSQPRGDFANFRLIKRARGEVLIQTFGQRQRLKIRWHAPAYLTQNPYSLTKTYLT